MGTGATTRRLVVKGYAQKEGIDFNEIFFQVVQMTIVRVVLALCATYDLHLEQLDVAGPNKDHINKLKAQLAREFEIKDLGPANKILGMQIYRDRLSSKMSHSSEKERIEMSRVPYASAVGKFNVRDDLYKTRHCTCSGSSESDLVVKGYVDSD
ncbi:gag-pol polyprotein [Tanacetum coccineum]